MAQNIQIYQLGEDWHENVSTTTTDLEGICRTLDLIG